LLAVSRSIAEFSWAHDPRAASRYRSIGSVTIDVIRRVTSRAQLMAVAEAQFGDLVKAVVDVRRRVMAIGGELHADEEAALIEDGSAQGDLWGINVSR
jgi:hypothetical protein